jgi:hypothetical protein
VLISPVSVSTHHRSPVSICTHVLISPVSVNKHDLRSPISVSTHHRSPGSVSAHGLLSSVSVSTYDLISPISVNKHDLRSPISVSTRNLRSPEDAVIYSKPLASICICGSVCCTVTIHAILSCCDVMKPEHSSLLYCNVRDLAMA